MHVFAAVTHESLHTDLMGLESLVTLPEMRGLFVENQTNCATSLGNNRPGNDLVVMVDVQQLKSENQGQQPRLVSSTWAWRNCRTRSADTQYPHVGIAMKMAAEHARVVGFVYDIAVRARPDSYFPLPFDVVQVHNGLRSRPSAVASGGRYMAVDTNMHSADLCAHKAATSPSRPCYLQAIGDTFTLGTFQLMWELWVGMMGNQTSQWGYVASSPCCEDYLFLHLAFRMGIRQAPDRELVPTLPQYAWWRAAKLDPSRWHPWISSVMSSRPWTRSVWTEDALVPGINCSDSRSSKPTGLGGSSGAHLHRPESINEMCVLPGRNRNRCPWSYSNLQSWVLGHRKKVPWYQHLASYTAPLYRLKPYLPIRLELNSIQAIDDWVADTLPASTKAAPRTRAILQAFRCSAHLSHKNATPDWMVRCEGSMVQAVPRRYVYSRHMHFQ